MNTNTTRPTITLGTHEYPVSEEAMATLADSGADVAAGLVDATDVIVSILIIEGYGDDPNVRHHRR